MAGSIWHVTFMTEGVRLSMRPATFMAESMRTKQPCHKATETAELKHED